MTPRDHAASCHPANHLSLISTHTHTIPHFASQRTKYLIFQVMQKTWLPQVFQLCSQQLPAAPSIPRRKPAISCESVRRAALKPSRCTCVCARSARPSLRTGMRWRGSGMPFQAGDQGVATWEEMNRMEMGISWDIWYLLISNMSEPGNWDGDNFICIEKGILRTGEYAFLFVRLRLTLPPPGPRVGQRRLLQQTSNRWVLEALQGEGLPALRGDDRKRPALWLFSQIFPALVFVQD